MFFFVWDTTCFYLGGVEKNPPHNSHYITLKVIENDVGFDVFFGCFKKRPGLEVALTRQGVEFSGFRLRKSAETARMSNWDGSCYSGIMVNGSNGLFHLLINGVYWGYNLYLLTIDPIFQLDIQVDTGRGMGFTTPLVGVKYITIFHNHLGNMLYDFWYSLGY